MGGSMICSICRSKPVKVYTAYAMGASCNDCNALKYKRADTWALLVSQYRAKHGLSRQQQIPIDARLEIEKVVDTLYPIPNP